MKQIEAFVSSRPKGKEQILGIFDFLEVFFQSNDFNGCWCINTVAEISSENIVVRGEIQKQKTNLLQLISKLLIENLDTRSTTEISSLARKIYLLYESAVSESHLHQDNWPIKETKNVCAQLIA